MKNRVMGGNIRGCDQDGVSQSEGVLLESQVQGEAIGVKGWKSKKEVESIRTKKVSTGMEHQKYMLYGHCPEKTAGRRIIHVKDRKPSEKMAKEMSK